MTKSQCNGVDARVGRRVRMTRIFRDRSILDAARHLGVSVLEYAELEEGKRRFDAAQLTKLSDVFQVSVTMFFGETERFDLRSYHRESPIMHYATNDNGARRSSRSD